MHALILAWVACAPASAAYLEKMGGSSSTISVKSPTGTSDLRARGASIEAGETLFTGPGTAVDVRFADDSLVRLAENSSLRLVRESATSLELDEAKGRLRALVKPLDAKHPTAARFRLRTAEALVQVQGTEFDLASLDGVTAVSGLDGTTILSAPVPGKDGEVQIHRGFRSKISGTAGAVPAAPEKFGYQEYVAIINGAKGPYAPLADRKNSEKPPRRNP